MNTKQSILWQRLALAGLAAAGFASVTTAAVAGECPANQRVADGRGQQPGPTAPQDVTDKIIAMTDLTKEQLGIKDRLFRARQLEVKPGGIVPWHSHGDRPAMIYVVSGEIVEYASTCAVPIEHRAGEVTAERAPTSHWWQNTGKVPAVLISVDLFRIDDKVNEKMM
jgi:quercetin dioxygenase-like cupin family protein